MKQVSRFFFLGRDSIANPNNNMASMASDPLQVFFVRTYNLTSYNLTSLLANQEIGRHLNYLIKDHHQKCMFVDSLAET